MSNKETIMVDTDGGSEVGLWANFQENTLKWWFISEIIQNYQIMNQKTSVSRL
jgi:hypothetical protein